MIIRATGIYIHDDKILLLEQDVASDNRSYSLPGGTFEEEKDRTIEECLIREMKEETGLQTKPKRLLYVCDHWHKDTYIAHITFEVEKTGGLLTGPTPGLDSVKIHRTIMVPIAELQEYGFSERFADLAQKVFPETGYKGLKKNIGL